MGSRVKWVAYIRFTQFGGPSMPPGDRVSDQDILTDIRSGMSQIRLLEKYRFVPKGITADF